MNVKDDTEGTYGFYRRSNVKGYRMWITRSRD